MALRMKVPEISITGALIFLTEAIRSISISLLLLILPGFSRG
jgi:hypothetical protein